MNIYQRRDGKYVAAQLITTKKRYRTLLTKDFLPSEASSVDDLPKARTYVSAASVARAIRKYKNKL
jgi:hypothetical protein